MSGHSKWANIQHRKGRQDAKRGKEFTKAAKEIIIAAKSGGDPAGNPRLRAAIAAAKSINLPKDKIESAIRKGTGQDAGGELFEITYEGYATGGVAVIVETATDNKNRTVAEVRHLFTKHGGSMGESGSVSFMFDRLGVITLSKEKYAEEDTVFGASIPRWKISALCVILWKNRAWKWNQPLLPSFPKIMCRSTRKPPKSSFVSMTLSKIWMTCKIFISILICLMILKDNLSGKFASLIFYYENNWN